MTTFKKAVENLRPQIEKLGKERGYFEAYAKHGAPSIRETSAEHVERVRNKFYTLRDTTTAIFSHMNQEKMNSTMFDIYWNAWSTEYDKYRPYLERFHSGDKEAA